MAQASQLGRGQGPGFRQRVWKGALAPGLGTGELLPTIASTEPESGGHVLGMASAAAATAAMS